MKPIPTDPSLNLPHLTKPLKRFWNYIPSKRSSRYYLGELDPASRRSISRAVLRAFCQQVSVKGVPSLSYQELVTFVKVKGGSERLSRR